MWRERERELENEKRKRERGVDGVGKEGLVGRTKRGGGWTAVKAVKYQSRDGSCHRRANIMGGVLN